MWRRSAYNWLHIQLNTLLPHCRFQTPEWLSDSIRRLLDEYESGGSKKDAYKPWDFIYDEGQDCFICPQGCQLRHTTTNKGGKRFYRNMPKDCRNCPCREQYGANEKGQRFLTTHIWQEYLDLAEQLRKTERGKDIYALRKQTIERIFADAKDKHGMRYTYRRGLSRVSSWVGLKFAALNLRTCIHRR